MESEISKKDAEKLALANNYMGLLLNNLFVKEETNVVFSPFSISIALAMLFYGARNETAEEIRNVIGYKFANVKDDKPKAYFQKFLNELDNISDSYTLTCANTVVSDKEFKVKRKYISLLEEYFKAFFQEADFNNEIAEVVKLINEWVSKKTCGMIPTFLESLDPSTVMVILNAVYFKGSWMHQFDKEKTSLQRFYNKGKNGKKVEMMHLTNNFSFVEKESFKALQLPYKGEEISMLILLPNLKNGLEKLETSLTPNFVQDLTQEMINRKVEVALPKFKLEYFKALKKFFISLGLKTSIWSCSA
ncbi:uncharacterized serpin-like protein TK1782 [Caerostris extrusa]|uniref:Uncharacterized serpin-like protein TK1782 n=1 Tax=Caerostris extrusa TaxID=172846 RepID=A0AAV4TN09_CAEEX|nr:uncharacterized serpin-like protein TK1782 [Caerostris extrusa]